MKARISASVDKVPGAAIFRTHWEPETQGLDKAIAGEPSIADRVPRKKESAERHSRLSSCKLTCHAGSTVPRTLLLCGIPRSGSSLCCRLAGGAPDTVALSEPIDPRSFESIRDGRDACARIRDFAATTRAELLVEGRARTMQVDGWLNDDRVSEARSSNGLRESIGGAEDVVFDKPLSDDFILLIKHNALFAALIGTLADEFPVIGLVRNPIAVLASWQTVNLPVQRGRIPMGEHFDSHLARTLDEEPDTLRRQVYVLNWFFAQFEDGLTSEQVVRYEDVVATDGLLLFTRLGVAPRPEPLRNRNANALYGGGTIEATLEAALGSERAWSSWYSESDCELAAAAIGAHL